MTAPVNPLTADGQDRIRQLALRQNVATYPIANFDVRKFGAYNAVRSKPSEGACGPSSLEPLTFKDAADEKAWIAKRWPCTHKGVDLAAPPGTRVVAPHDGWVLYWGPANDAPFKGYGPWVMLIAHDDIKDPLWDRIMKQANEPLIADWHPTAQAARYSLIAHLDPMPGTSPRVPMSNYMFQTGNKKHWRTLKDGTIVMTFVPDDSRYIYTGDDIGTVSDRGHVHWELRNSPLADKSGRLDAMEVWRTFYKVPTPSGAVVAPAAGGGGGGWLLLLLLALASKRGR
jgi:hypothetical protein